MCNLPKDLAETVDTIRGIFNQTNAVGLIILKDRVNTVFKLELSDTKDLIDLMVDGYRLGLCEFQTLSDELERKQNAFKKDQLSVEDMLDYLDYFHAQLDLYNQNNQDYGYAQILDVVPKIMNGAFNYQTRLDTMLKNNNGLKKAVKKLSA